MIVPIDYVELCQAYHSGQASIMYAISSTGSLELGNRRPLVNDEEGWGTRATDDQWLYILLGDLLGEVADALKMESPGPGKVCLTYFKFWVADELEKLENQGVEL